jgi:8-oxo-dGTP pyrophosphatase MutT (NUDIX family)
MNKNMICKNCNRPFHTLKQCKYPITSYGIILFRIFHGKIQYLMIRRKNSFGYIDFIKGQYTENNFEYLQQLFDEMSIEEKKIISENNDFDILWKKMWEDNFRPNIFNTSKQKFINLKNSGMLDQIIANSTTNWHETEWEFPKGRRNYMEKDLECALREFQEETGVNCNNITLIENLLSFEELFTGTNYKSYKNKYFLAFLKNPNDCDDSNNFNELDNYQISEVSKIEWKSLEDCSNSIRPYNIEKIKLINQINQAITEYQIIL